MENDIDKYPQGFLEDLKKNNESNKILLGKEINKSLKLNNLEKYGYTLNTELAELLK